MFYFLEIMFNRLLKKDIIYKIKEPTMKRVSSIDEFIKSWENLKSENPLCIYTDPPYFYNDMIDNRNHIKIINKDK